MKARAPSARAALDAAEQDHATARAALATAEQDHGRAKARAKAARVAYGDDPSPETQRARDDAKHKLGLAKDREDGARRKLTAAASALTAARKAEAQASLAREMPRTDRGALFDALAPQIKACARVDIAPPVDVYAGTDRVLVKALAKRAERDLDRARAARGIRSAVLAQHASVAEVERACGVLGQPVPPDVGAVSEEHVSAAIELEAFALRPDDGPIEQGRWTGWAAAILPGVPLLHVPPTFAAFLAWARTVVRTGATPRPPEMSAAERKEAQREEEKRAAEARREQEEQERLDAEEEEQDRIDALARPPLAQVYQFPDERRNVA